VFCSPPSPPIVYPDGDTAHPIICAERGAFVGRLGNARTFYEVIACKLAAPRRRQGHHHKKSVFAPNCRPKTQLYFRATSKNKQKINSTFALPARFGAKNTNLKDKKWK